MVEPWVQLFLEWAHLVATLACQAIQRFPTNTGVYGLVSYLTRVWTTPPIRLVEHRQPTSAILSLCVMSGIEDWRRGSDLICFPTQLPAWSMLIASAETHIG
jgi:hypothetical protein